MVAQGNRRRLRLVALAVALGLAGGCGGVEPAARVDDECSPFSAYRGHEGETVTMYSSITDVEADKLQRSWEKFSECTGITIDYEGSTDFEKQLVERVDAGRPPDLTVFPQPGLLATMARGGDLRPATKQVEANTDKWWSADWKAYGTVDGTFYAAPFGASVKSFVWYSPKFFKSQEYTVPSTWDEMMALSDKIAASGMKPWCAGIMSGEATGWPVTDWLEDVLLRSAGADVYDKWVAHEVAFDDPRIVAALDRVGQILKNPEYVNGGFGDVRSIAKTGFQEGGQPILDNKCAMHRQASFYTNQWPAGAKISENGDVYAFYLPPMSGTKGKPILGAGEFLGAFSDKPAVGAVTAYLSTPEWVNSRARLGGMASANTGIDKTLLQTPIDRLSTDLLTNPDVTFRFDGSDLMPPSIGAGSFWRGMTDWVNGKATSVVLSEIESSWPG
jgi:alpha-glucoside transport system substrate-binding protein